MAAMWTAFDMASLQGNVDTALLVGVGLALGFLSLRLIKKSSNKVG